MSSFCQIERWGPAFLRGILSQGWKYERIPFTSWVLRAGSFIITVTDEMHSIEICCLTIKYVCEKAYKRVIPFCQGWHMKFKPLSCAYWPFSGLPCLVNHQSSSWIPVGVRTITKSHWILGEVLEKSICFYRRVARGMEVLRCFSFASSSSPKQKHSWNEALGRTTHKVHSE